MQLLVRTIALVKMGAFYAIDGAAEDLITHFKGPAEEDGGFDVIVDVNGCLGGAQGALLGLLVGEGRVVDCAGVDVEGGRRGMLADGRGLVTAAAGVAREICEVLATIPEDELSLERPNAASEEEPDSGEE